MTMKRFISFFFALVILMSAMGTSFYAVDGEDEYIEYVEEEVEEEEAEEEEETEEPTEAPTEPPTDPPYTPATYGYKGYADRVESTVYHKELGAFYSSGSTQFLVWSPVASDVKVNIYKTGSDEEEGAQMLSSTSMNYSPSDGVWYITLEGDYKNMFYTYQVTVDGKTNEVVDPYAKAVGVNGNRGMIVDLSETNPEGWTDDSFARVNSINDAIVWEVSVRDFSASASSGVTPANRGKFLAFTEEGTTLNGTGDIPTCVNYLKSLGVNYVQINPFYDFASIDETKPLDEQYNWGYDPKNYNVPEGSYSSDPYDGKVRISECKQMIAALHKAGIGVVMDVVYNHTYENENSFLNMTVPYYYYRMNEDGSWSNGSGCGNDIATERTMARKLIIDSVAYWAREYHIDGFRFDLMGLMDVNTMNGVREALDSLSGGDKILMYGEGWNMNTSAPSDVKLANQNNMHLLSKRIAAFNDTSRDAVKGSNFNAREKGFVQEGSSKAGVREAMEGVSFASAPSQVVNYVSCHDNLTLYDKLTASVYGDEKYDIRREDLVAMNKLAAAIVMSSRGMSFFLAGEEMGRTKMGDENSYISSVEINQLEWNNLAKYTSLNDYYKGLIKIRKNFSMFRDPTGESTSVTAFKDDVAKETIAYLIESKESSDKGIVIFNGNTSSSSKVNLPEGEWVVIADQDRAGLTPLDRVTGSVTAAPSSAVILVSAETFSEISEEAYERPVVYAQLYDTITDSVVLELSQRGAIGDSYIFTVPTDMLFTFNDLSNENDRKGVFKDNCEYIRIKVSAYVGEFSTVTFHFVDKEGTELSNAVETSNRVGQQYFTPYIPKIEGYSLDLDNLPENGAGKYTKDPIDVYYTFDYTVDEPIEGIDPSMTSRANIIYMGNSGEILSVKKYAGTLDEAIEIARMDFKDYAYVSMSTTDAVFSVAETNIIIYYESTKKSILPYILLSLGACVVAAAAILLLSKLSVLKSKKDKMKSLSIDE